MYLSWRLLSVHSDPLHPPVSGYVPWSLALCRELLGTGRRKPVRSWARAAPGTGNALSHQLPSPKLLCTHFCFSFCVFPPHPPCYSWVPVFFHTRVKSTSASWVPAVLTKLSSVCALFPFFLKRPVRNMSAPHPQALAAVPRGPWLPGVTHTPARLKQAAHASIDWAMKHPTTGYDCPAAQFGSAGLPSDTQLKPPYSSSLMDPLGRSISCTLCTAMGGNLCNPEAQTWRSRLVL